VRINRILFHLLDNALKYTDNGIVELGFNVIGNEKIVFFVKDKGIGIREENKKLIWESFYKGDASETRFYKGAGLGLSICKKTTNLLGGEIWCESEYENGSCFYLSLPILSPLSDYDENSSKYHYPEVLIVDEDIDSFRKIQEVVASYGLNVLWARNGVEALGLITMEPTVKLLICNLFSNNMEGILSVQLIKNINRTVKTFVIGSPNTISEFKETYDIEVDYSSTLFIDDFLFKDILTQIKKKEQL